MRCSGARPPIARTTCIPERSLYKSLYAHGLMPIPCSADDDGKVPGVRWSQWTRRPGVRAVTRLAERFSTENVGIITGLSNVTIIDVDDPRMSIPDVARRFGATPMITKTPSGGRHHWYRATNERCSNMRTQGLPIDVKGLGGFVVVPPSIRPSGVHAGKRYEFLDGGWADLARLPRLKPGALPESPAISPPTTREGQRNDRLFRTLMAHARACDSLDALLDVASYENERFMPPLPHAEVIKAAASAWSYEQRGSNFAGGGSGVFVARAAIDALVKHRRGADAMAMLVILRAKPLWITT